MANFSLTWESVCFYSKATVQCRLLTVVDRAVYSRKMPCAEYALYGPYGARMVICFPLNTRKGSSRDYVGYVPSACGSLAKFCNFLNFARRVLKFGSAELSAEDFDDLALTPQCLN